MKLPSLKVYLQWILYLLLIGGLITFFASYSVYLKSSYIDLIQIHSIRHLEKLENLKVELDGMSREKIRKIRKSFQFQTREALLDFQHHREERLRQKTIEYFEPLDMKAHMAGKAPALIGGVVLQQSAPDFFATQRAIVNLFGPNEKIHKAHYYEIHGNHKFAPKRIGYDVFPEHGAYMRYDRDLISRKDFPETVALQKLGLKPILDFDRRTISLKSEEFKKLDLADGVRDGKYQNERLSKDLLVDLFNLEPNHFTWSPIGTKEEKEEAWVLSIRPPSRRARKLLEKIGGNLTLTTSLAMQFTRLGKVFTRHTGQFQDFLNAKMNVRDRLFDLNNIQLYCDFFPPNYMQEPEKAKEILLMPEKYIAIWISKEAVRRSLFQKLLDDQTTHDANVGVVDNSNAIQFVAFKRGLQLAEKSSALPREWIAQIRPFQPSNHHKVYRDKESGWRLLSTHSPGKQYTFYYSEPLLKLLKPLILEYVFIFLGLLVVLILGIRVIRAAVSLLVADLDECLKLLGSSTDGYGSIQTSEFSVLGSQICEFDQSMLEREEFESFCLEAAQILRQPRHERSYYYEQLRALSKSYGARIYSPVDEAVQNVSGHDSGSTGVSNLIPSEMEAFDHLLKTFSERSDLEEKLVKSDKIQAELQLASEVSRSLIIADFEEDGDPYVVRSKLVKGSLLGVFCAGRVVSEKEQTYFQIQSFSEDDHVGVFFSLTLKACLVGLIEDGMPLTEIMGYMSQVHRREEFHGVFSGAGILQIKMDDLSYSYLGAGHPGLNVDGELKKTIYPPLGMGSFSKPFTELCVSGKWQELSLASIGLYCGGDEEGYHQFKIENL